MKKQEFLEEVKREIEAIKKYATPEELSLLDIDRLDPSSSVNCIYGQMSFDCESHRAKTLMEKGCVRVINISDTDLFFKVEGGTFQNIKKYVNGLFKGEGWKMMSRDYNGLV